MRGSVTPDDAEFPASYAVVRRLLVLPDIAEVVRDVRSSDPEFRKRLAKKGTVPDDSH